MYYIKEIHKNLPICLKFFFHSSRQDCIKLHKNRVFKHFPMNFPGYTDWQYNMMLYRKAFITSCLYAVVLQVSVSHLRSRLALQFNMLLGHSWLTLQRGTVSVLYWPVLTGLLLLRLDLKVLSKWYSNHYMEWYFLTSSVHISPQGLLSCFCLLIILIKV